MLDTPDEGKPMSKGVCKLCDEVREFSNWLPIDHSDKIHVGRYPHAGKKKRGEGANSHE